MLKKCGNNGDISDVFDGILCRELLKNKNFTFNANGLTYTISCDGASLSKSSNLQAWPVLFSINEVPLSLRFNDNYIITAGLWVSNSQTEINFNVFMKHLAEQLDSLINPGITWTKGSESINTQLYPLMVVADAPARAKLVCMVNHSGFYACTWCEQAGVHYGGAVRYLYEPNKAERTMTSMKEYATEAAEVSKTIKGVKGHAPLSYISHLDYVRGIVPDYMHCIMLGVVKTLFNIWMSNTKTYLKSDKKLIEDNLLKIKVPSCFNRFPRAFNDWKQYKATEFQNFLLYYVFPCFKEILNSQYLEHFLLLQQAVSILLTKPITESMLLDANVLLECFVCGYQELYSEDHMTFNVHLLLHQVDAVRYCGPFWTTSAYPYENFLRFLRKQMTGTKVPAKQIVKKLQIRQFLCAPPDDFSTKERREECMDLLKLNPIKLWEAKNNYILSKGTCVNISELNDKEQNLITSYANGDSVFSHRMFKFGNLKINLKERSKVDDTHFVLYNKKYVKVK